MFVEVINITNGRGIVICSVMTDLLFVYNVCTLYDRRYICRPESQRRARTSVKSQGDCVDDVNRQSADDGISTCVCIREVHCMGIGMAVINVDVFSVEHRDGCGMGTGSTVVPWEKFHYLH